MTDPTPAEFEAISAVSPLGAAHYADRTDDRGTYRVLCECPIGTAHDEAGNPAPLRWPTAEYSEAWRWVPVLPAGTEAVNYLKPTMGASSE